MHKPEKKLKQLLPSLLKIQALMEQHVFYYFDDYRGRHRKSIAIYTATEINLQKHLGFIQQKCIFEH